MILRRFALLVFALVALAASAPAQLQITLPFFVVLDGSGSNAARVFNDQASAVAYLEALADPRSAVVYEVTQGRPRTVDTVCQIVIADAGDPGTGPGDGTAVAAVTDCERDAGKLLAKPGARYTREFGALPRSTQAGSACDSGPVGFTPLLQGGPNGAS